MVNTVVVVINVSLGAAFTLCTYRLYLIRFNPFVTNGLSHPYNLGESISTFRNNSGAIFIFISFIDEIRLSK